MKSMTKNMPIGTPRSAPSAEVEAAASAAHAEQSAQSQRWQDAEELRWAARHWATQLGVKTPRIHIQQMSSKWASISTAGRLTLNTDLLPLPKRLGEFVIVHELVHFLAPNHGKVFKSFMHAYLPDWQARERELRQRGDGRMRASETEERRKQRDRVRRHGL